MKSVANIIAECVKDGGYTINDIIAIVVEQGYTNEDALEGVNAFVKENASPPDMLF